MSYEHPHEYEAGADGDFCHRPAPAADASRVPVCARRPEHPIHDLIATDQHWLAQRLSEHQWATEGTPARIAVSEHRRHNLDHECGLCTGDVHEVAAAVLRILRPPDPQPRTTGIDILPPRSGWLAAWLRRTEPPPRTRSATHLYRGGSQR